MRLSHNMNSLRLNLGYQKTLKDNVSAIGRISSGVKINSAKDNPNKIAQSESMRIQIRSLQSAQKNLQDGQSMLQTADGALQEANNVLARMKELAISAGDGSKTEADRSAIQAEMTTMKDTLNSLAKDTEFNGVKLIGDENVSSNEYPSYKDTVVGAMVGEKVRIPAYNISASFLHNDEGNALSDIDLTDPDKVDQAIGVIDASITSITSIRSKYGAISNRFESSAESLEQNTLIVEKADSSLRDTDIAVEMAEFARTQILTQTSIALIAQSNNFPQDALKVLERIR
ncbi:flagellin [Clostridium vincentii]|uniref:Flagellin n=1 Tax=Clostridium vincentii TaxID=52704 RepID=A0A2T0B6C2_9CLOT|nr:flagellin [Clostridium vincentii]PRR79439.1 Flagellar filament 30.7 kDa core protein [Clostridium vincentii]